MRLIPVARMRPLAELGRKPKRTKPDPKKPRRSNWTFAELIYRTIDDAAASARRRIADRRNESQRATGTLGGA